MTSTIADPDVADALDALDAAIASLSAASVWRLSAAEKADSLERLERLRRRVDYCGLRMIRDMSTSGADVTVGAPSMTALLRGRLRLSPREASRRVAVAANLCPSVARSGQPIDPVLPAAAEAMRAGDIGLEHASGIGSTMRRLPDSTDAATRTAAEHTLVGNARRFDPSTLGRVGRHLLHRLAPNLEPTPEEVDRTRGLRFFDDLPGIVGFSGTCSAADAATIRTALDPLAAPRPSTDHDSDVRSLAQRNLDALVELAHRALDSGTLPISGGERPHVSLTLPAAEVEAGGDVTWAGPVSARTAAWIACDAQVTPIVLGADGVPQRIGNPSRTVPAWLRRSVIARDRGCAFPDCDRPPGWSDVHHIVPWERGGPHHLENLTLVCRHHHRLVHHEAWTVQMEGGIPHFRPPPWIDPQQRPRRNHLHHAAVRVSSG